MNARQTIFAVRMLVFAVMACVGCAAPIDGEDARDEEPVATTQQAITNAGDDLGDPAVVALLFEGKVFCTGVLVTASVVATAAHCVTPTPPDQVYFGTDPASKKGTFIAAADTMVHPEFDEESLVNDVALIGLAGKAPVAPVRVLMKPFDASFVGLEVRIVGFGSPAVGRENDLRKRVGTTRIKSYGADDFRFQPGPSQTCNGDSGGPAFAMIDGKEAVVGLASSGDSGCKEYGRNTRMDTYVSFFQSYTKSYSVTTPPAPMENKGCTTAPGATGRGLSCGHAVWLLLALAWRVRQRRR